METEGTTMIEDLDATERRREFWCRTAVAVLPSKAPMGIEDRHAARAAATLADAMLAEAVLRGWI